MPILSPCIKLQKITAILLRTHLQTTADTDSMHASCHTVVHCTLLLRFSLLFPALLLLSLMEGERSRFLIRLLIVVFSTVILICCAVESMFPANKRGAAEALRSTITVGNQLNDTRLKQAMI